MLLVLLAAVPLLAPTRLARRTGERRIQERRSSQPGPLRDLLDDIPLVSAAIRSPHRLPANPGEKAWEDASRCPQGGLEAERWEVRTVICR